MNNRTVLEAIEAWMQSPQGQEIIAIVKGYGDADVDDPEAFAYRIRTFVEAGYVIPSNIREYLGIEKQMLGLLVDKFVADPVQDWVAARVVANRATVIAQLMVHYVPTRYEEIRLNYQSTTHTREAEE